MLKNIIEITKKALDECKCAELKAKIATGEITVNLTRSEAGIDSITVGEYLLASVKEVREIIIPKDISLDEERHSWKCVEAMRKDNWILLVVNPNTSAFHLMFGKLQ